MFVLPSVSNFARVNVQSEFCVVIRKKNLKTISYS